MCVALDDSWSSPRLYPAEVLLSVRPAGAPPCRRDPSCTFVSVYRMSSPPLSPPGVFRRDTGDSIPNFLFPSIGPFVLSNLVFRSLFSMSPGPLPLSYPSLGCSYRGSLPWNRHPCSLRSQVSRWSRNPRPHPTRPRSYSVEVVTPPSLVSPVVSSNPFSLCTCPSRPLVWSLPPPNPVPVYCVSIPSTSQPCHFCRTPVSCPAEPYLHLHTRVDSGTESKGQTWYFPRGSEYL